ncbi:MAG TPA: hypothetical protein VD962_07355 [Rubricoccaceae bacterium]|nr:hypothetical protein [Rubricoccaceae bacterium]
MRKLLCLAALLAIAALPARDATAQFHFSPLFGYDIDYEALMVGLGFEVPVTPGFLPVSASLRPSVEYVFLDQIEGVEASLFRANGDVLARFSLPAAPISPYGKAGVAAEFASIDVDGESESNTEIGINLGGGVLFNSFFVEATAGLMEVSNFRVAAGYRF